MRPRVAEGRKGTRTKTKEINNLNQLKALIDFLPVDEFALELAAQLWAEAVRPRVGVRRKGTRTEETEEYLPPTISASMPMSSSAPSINY